MPIPRVKTVTLIYYDKITNQCRLILHVVFSADKCVNKFTIYTEVITRGCRGMDVIVSEKKTPDKGRFFSTT